MSMFLILCESSPSPSLPTSPSYGTWTNGPVAISYLSTLLSAPLTFYAFRGGGGSTFGATVNNEYTTSLAGAQSLNQQIANYTSAGSADITQSLQFIWISENDLSAQTDAFWEGDPHKSWFAGIVSAYIASYVSTHLNAGAHTFSS